MGKQRQSFLLLLAGIPPALILGCLGAETAGSHPVGWLLVALSVAYLAAAPRCRPLADAVNSLRAKGCGWLWLAMSGTVSLCLAAPVEHLAGAELLPANEYLEPFGTVCTIGGAALGVWARQARRKLERMVLGGDQVTWTLKGPYHSLRYPGFAALLTFTLGLALGYGSLAALALVACLIVPGVVLHIHRHERRMLALFGSAYRGYHQRTARLLPGLW